MTPRRSASYECLPFGLIAVPACGGGTCERYLLIVEKCICSVSEKRICSKSEKRICYYPINWFVYSIQGEMNSFQGLLDTWVFSIHYVRARNRIHCIALHCTALSGTESRIGQSARFCLIFAQQVLQQRAEGTVHNTYSALYTVQCSQCRGHTVQTAGAGHPLHGASIYQYLQNTE
jgi:hypothetical protein